MHADPVRLKDAHGIVCGGCGRTFTAMLWVGLTARLDIRCPHCQFENRRDIKAGTLNARLDGDVTVQKVRGEANAR